jgi:anti-sigma-K factor RskA
VAPDAVAKKSESERQAVVDDASAKKRNAEHQSTAEAKRSWWRRSAAWCGAAVAVVAVGLAVELTAVAHHNVSVCVVPT